MTSATLSAVTIHNSFVCAEIGKFSFPNNFGGHDLSFDQCWFLQFFFDLVNGLPMMGMLKIFRILCSQVVEFAFTFPDCTLDVVMGVA